MLRLALNGTVRTQNQKRGFDLFVLHLSQHCCSFLCSACSNPNKAPLCGSHPPQLYILTKKYHTRWYFFCNIWLGRKDSNLRDGWTKTSCLTTWRRPINVYHSIIIFQAKLSRYFLFYIFCM